jgi:hypothetical protein
MKDRELLQQALDALETISEFAVGEGDVCEIIAKRARLAIPAMRERLAHCDRCGKKLGGEGDIHTCTPDPIGDAQDRLIAEMAAQPEKEPVAHLWKCLGRWSAYLASNGEQADCAPPSWLVEAVRDATPPAAQRQPLTDEWIRRTTVLMGFNPEWTTEIGIAHAIVRAAEAAHGITGEKT